MKKYIELKKNGQNATHLEVEVYYNKGGFSCWTYRTEERGYYLSVVPVERAGNMIGFVAFSGLKKLIKAVGRKGAKAEAEAEQLALNQIDSLVNAVLQKNGLELA